MKAAQRIAVTQMAEVLDAAGLSWRTQNGGKHLCVVVTDLDGHEHKMPVSGTPRDQDAAANMQRQQAQRLIERLGVGERRGLGMGQAQARKVRQHRSRQPDRLVIVMRDHPDPDDGPMRDPWAALAGLTLREKQGEPEAAPPPAPPTLWARFRAWISNALQSKGQAE